MQESDLLDEVDLAIFHALEISPRASWARVGAVVGVDPVTAARRWDTMATAHRAFVTSYPLLTRETHAAFIEIRCLAGHVRSVAAALARYPHAVRVDIVSGGSDLLVIAGAVGAEGLSRFVLDRIPAIPGVQAVVSQPVVAIHVEGGFVAEGSLHRSARDHLHLEQRRGTLIPSAGRVDDLDWRICLALSRDGRASIAELSRTVGASTTTVTRRLRRLVADGALSLRAKLAPSAAPTNAAVWLGIRVPPADVPTTLRAIARLVGVTSLSLVAGSHNLWAHVVLPHLAALEAFEARIHRINPDLGVESRMVVLEEVRHISRIFDTHGDAVETVSIDLRTPSA